MEDTPIIGSGRALHRSFSITIASIIFVISSSTVPCVNSHSQYTDSWAVEVRGGRHVANKLAETHGFINVGQVGNLKDMFHFTLPSDSHGGTTNQQHSRTIQSLQSHEDQWRTTALLREPSVGYVLQQELLQLDKRSYSPPQDPNWTSQWSLKNVGQTSGRPGLDLNVEPVWMQGITGRGVVVTVVDDGLEANHPDLEINFDSQASHDFVDHDDDPSPTGAEDYHGTACAGIIGMAQNGLCGVGVAPGTSLGGLKLDISYTFDITQATILSYQDSYVDVYSNSWGPMETGFTVGGPGYLTRQTFKTEAQLGRNSKGSIYVWAAGNGGSYFDSCAADGYVNSIYTIAVGSADQNGQQAYYDENCSAKMAVTFSYNSDSQPSTGNRHNQLYTTSPNGQCSDSFSGTSASAPLLAGVVALALEANPDLTWRDVQYLIVYTSNIDILTLDDVQTNVAGLKFSHSVGFGAIDAEAMVTRARHWINVPEQVSQSFTHNTIHNIQASDSLVIEFNVDNSRWDNYETILSLEHVVLTISLEVRDYEQEYKSEDYFNFYKTVGNNTEQLVDWLTDPHPRRGDIEIQLTSPQNTTSTLLPYRDFDFVNSDGYEDWSFMTVHNWGENPHGTWRLTITYKSNTGYVYVDDVDLTLYGTLTVPKSVRDIPTECDTACSRTRGCSGEGPQNCDSCKQLRLDTTLECVEECPEGYREYLTYCICEDCDTLINSTTDDIGVYDNDDDDDDDGNHGGSDGGSIQWNLSLLVCFIVGCLILVFLIVVCFFTIQITRQRYCKTKHNPFARLQDDIYPITSV